MTDNEIIEALECCSSREVECRRCPCADTNGSCYDNSAMLKGALDLINRQKAEIEKQRYILMGVMHSVDKWLEGDELKQDETNRAITMREKTLQITEKLQHEKSELKAEIEELNHDVEVLYRVKEQLKIMYKTAKSEAIKEFAERLKENYNVIFGRKAVSIPDIDNLVKEMTEGSK